MHITIKAMKCSMYTSRGDHVALYFIECILPTYFLSKACGSTGNCFIKMELTAMVIQLLVICFFFGTPSMDIVYPSYCR